MLPESPVMVYLLIAHLKIFYIDFIKYYDHKYSMTITLFFKDISRYLGFFVLLGSDVSKQNGKYVEEKLLEKYILRTSSLFFLPWPFPALYTVPLVLCF